jgi:hypothetical protein
MSNAESEFIHPFNESACCDVALCTKMKEEKDVIDVLKKL